MRFFAALCLVLSIAAPAAAQHRSPVQRQVLIDLSRTIGESHALRQLCEGDDDQYWRERMKSLVNAERPEASLETALLNAFNAGFEQRSAQFRACSPAARRALAQASAKGSALARRLAKPEG